MNQPMNKTMNKTGEVIDPPHRALYLRLLAARSGTPM